jgi:hypothetical protein
MSRTIAFVCALVSSISSFAQNGNIEPTRQDITIGKNLITNQNINATKITFPCFVYQWQGDTTGQNILLQLRYLTSNGKYFKNKGFVGVYNAKGQSIIWAQETKNFDIKLSGSAILQRVGNNTQRLSTETGKVVWENATAIYYVDPKTKIGLAYPIVNPSASNVNTLMGINMENGSTLWSHEINRDFGWNSLISMNDTSKLIVSSGLHRLNFSNGHGWDYTAITGVKEYSANAATLAAGITLGLATGIMLVPTGQNIVHDIASNLVAKNNLLYFASRESIACIDLKGNVVWQTSLPRKLTSKSTLIVENDVVYLINRGFAYQNNRLMEFGKPFIASFNLINGQQSYMTEFEKENQINAYYIHNNNLILVFPHKLARYNLSAGSLIDEKPMTENLYGELTYFIGNQAYVQNIDSTFTSLNATDTTHHFLYTSTGRILSISDNLQIDAQHDITEIYVNYLSTLGLNFLVKGSSTIVTNQQGEAIAIFDAPSNAVLSGTTLRYAQDNSLIEIDLSNLFKP